MLYLQEGIHVTVQNTTMGLKRVGYFRLVTGFNDPIVALANSIEEARSDCPDRDVSNSLIVLPEAFNIGHEYDPPGPDLCSEGILQRLHEELAAPLGIAFVAGVIHGTRSSAYWVDAGGPEAICHKMGDDGKGLYSPCLRGADKRNPFPCGNAHVGTLICMDAWDDDPPIRKRRNRLLADLENEAGYKILCVPAWPTINKPDPRAFQATVSDYWYVLASGGYLSTSSVAHVSASRPSEVPVTDSAPEGNRIRLLPLAQSTQVRSSPT